MKIHSCGEASAFLPLKLKTCLNFVLRFVKIAYQSVYKRLGVDWSRAM